MKQEDADHDPYQPHQHEPNPEPPGADPQLTLVFANGRAHPLTVSDMQAMPQTTLSDCYIVSTGHGTSGPFRFSGVALRDLLTAVGATEWTEAEVVSGDGFGNRVFAAEVFGAKVSRPMILALAVDGRALSRAAGLVRLIVPQETDDALRQVKWVREIRLY